MRRAPVWITCIALLVSGCVVGPTVADLDAADAESEDEDSAEGEAEDTDDDDEPDDEGLSFVPQDEPPQPKPFLECDPLQPVACDEGEKCNIFVYENEFHAGCVPLAEETASRGESCTLLEDVVGGDSCEAGTTCWDVMNDTGTCLSFCDVNDGDVEGQCGADFICNWGKSFPNDAGLCTPSCHPLQDDDCPSTCGCFWEGAAFLCLPLSSNLAPGEPCGFVNDCETGSFCTNAEVLPACEGSACCSEFCDLSAPECRAGMTCAAFFDEGVAPEGHELTGICLAPDA